jgi:hypothetical protein
LRLAVRREIAMEDPQDECQFLAVLPVASVAETTEPLRGVGLQNDRAGPDNFPTLAPGVASSTDLIQPPLGRGQILPLRQGSLASGLACAIDIEDLPLSACSIQQFASLLLFGEWMCPRIAQRAAKK